MTIGAEQHWESYGDVTIGGAGEEVELVIPVTRKRPRAGGYEHTKLRVTMHRYFIRKLLMEVGHMHIRDRKRLEDEARRIEREIRGLQEPT